MMPRLRPLLLLALLAGATIAGAPPSASAHPEPLEPLVNADFALPSHHKYARNEWLVGAAFDPVGSVLPGTTERDSARGGAFGWTHRVLSGQSAPHGRAEWSKAGLLRVHVDPLDDGPETAAITQPTGQRDRAALWMTPVFVDVHIDRVQGAPVEMRALVATLPGRTLEASSVAVLEPTNLPRVVRLTFPPEALQGMSQFYLAMNTDAPGGAVVHLDAIEMHGAWPRLKH